MRHPSCVRRKEQQQKSIFWTKEPEQQQEHNNNGVNDENKAEQIEVEIGDSAGDMIAVSGALAEGDRVAIRGAENLQEGADVKIKLSQRPATAARADG